jgi:hypothetical protein
MGGLCQAAFRRPRCGARLPVRYTHRIAIANSRLVAFDGERVTFKWKDYRAKSDARYKLMTLDADEFIRRFLIHVLPDGFHRIRSLRPLRQCQPGRQYRSGASSSAYPSQPRRRMRAVALKVVTTTKSGTLVLAAAGV